MKRTDGATARFRTEPIDSQQNVLTSGVAGRRAHQTTSPTRRPNLRLILSVTSGCGTVSSSTPRRSWKSRLSSHQESMFPRVNSTRSCDGEGDRL